MPVAAHWIKEAISFLYRWDVAEEFLKVFYKHDVLPPNNMDVVKTWTQVGSTTKGELWWWGNGHICVWLFALKCTYANRYTDDMPIRDSHVSNIWTTKGHEGWWGRCHRTLSEKLTNEQASLYMPILHREHALLISTNMCLVLPFTITNGTSSLGILQT